MADQADVEKILVKLIDGAIYPDGTATASIIGADCRIYRGWPNSAALNVDLANGWDNITVFPHGEEGRNTTRFFEQWLSGIAAPPALTVTVTGSMVAFGGTADPGQFVGLLVDGKTYIYQTRSGDTTAAVAANLAALAQADWVVQAAGSWLTIPSGGLVSARVVTGAQATREVRRQEQVFRIVCWCPTPEMRDAVSAAIDQSLASTTFIGLPDGTQGRIRYIGTVVFDQAEDALLYRRDLNYTVEYATIVIEMQPAMLFGNLIFNSVSIVA